MNLEFKRDDLLWQLIARIQDEQLRKEFKSFFSNVQKTKLEEPSDDFISEYRTEIKPVFDLDAIKKEQNYIPLISEEIDEFIDKIDLKETDEELLNLS